MICSPRKWQLLRALSQSIRLITSYQLARWWDVPSANASRALRDLVQDGLLDETRVLARRIPPIESPMFCWSPGQKTPNFGKLSYIAKNRFRRAPPITTSAFVATNVTLAQFTDQRAMRLKRTQSTHDLGVTEAYLYALRRWPLLTKCCWIGENLYSRDRGFGKKVEDAHFIHPKNGEVILAIEFAGTYPKVRFEALHEALKQKPYWIM